MNAQRETKKQELEAPVAIIGCTSYPQSDGYPSIPCGQIIGPGPWFNYPAQPPEYFDTLPVLSSKSLSFCYVLTTNNLYCAYPNS